MERRKTNPELASSHSDYGAPRPLNLGRKIFLSHSGKDKNFVRFLHKALCRQYHGVRFVFFDEKDLPTAEPISMKNILIEARGCELGVLVLSEDFFMHTPNPMLELEALTNSKVRLLPLFYKVSVDAFSKMRCDNVWEMRWKEWSVVDEEKMRRWRDALTLVNTFSGLEYCKLATNEDDYVTKIVEKVTSIVRPAISFSEEGVCGMDRLCKVVNNMYNNCALMRLSNGCTQAASTSIIVGCEEYSGKTLDLVGIYGFAGLGKTTLCKCLCDFYFAEFHGKVCWIDLGSKPSARISSQEHSFKAYRKRMQHILSRLTGSIDGVDSLEFFQVQYLLRNQISFRMDPIFLAIDNILPSREFLEEAHFYLSCNFPKGSKIFLTSRSEKILEDVTNEYSRFSVVIEHIPKLATEEAMNIFLHEIPKLQASDVEAEIEECVSMCIVYQQNERYRQHDNFWYHPLMVKSLAALLKNDRRPKGDWKSRLRELLSIVNVEKSDAWNTVFNMLDLTYKVLKEEEQKVFLDLTLFYMLSPEASFAWIQGVYSHLGEKKVNKILLLLEDLSFISCKDGIIQIHDLMVDFSKQKLLQGAAGFNLILEDGAHPQDPTIWFLANGAMGAVDEWPSYPSRSVRTVSISGVRRCDQLECLDLRNLEGVEVLHLESNLGVQEVLLSPTTMAHVRSFIVRVTPGTTSSLRCTMDEGWSRTSSSSASQCRPRGQVVWIELEGNVILATRRRQRSWWSNYTVAQSLQSFLQRLDNSSTAAAPGQFDLGLWLSLRNLQYLSLSHFPAQRIDLTSITSHLKELKLMSMPRLRNIHGLEKATNLETLFIKNCAKLELLNIPATPRLSSDISDCKSLERISLHYTLSYPGADCSDWFDAKLEISKCYALRSVDGIAQYPGPFYYFGDLDVRHGCMQEALRELLESAEPGSSKFTATVCTFLCLPTQADLGLAALYTLFVKDAQHVAFLTSALMFSAPATRLRWLDITCREDGDCGCDKNAPRFGPLPGCEEQETLFSFFYHCPQVRDLGSLARLGNQITTLNLRGCRSVDEWPDFATMTSLEDLKLSYTSLKELPGGVLLLPSLRSLDIEGCRQLPVEEMIKALTWKDLGYNCACGECLGYNCICADCSLKSLVADLRNHRRVSITMPVIPTL